MAVAIAKNSQIVRLDKSLMMDIENLAKAKATKKAADAEARAADSVVKALTAKLSLAMGAAVSAVCGEVTLTRKAGTSAEAALTLTDGRKVPWTTVTSVLVGNQHIPAAEVKILFGGREGSVSIDVTGV